MPSPRYSTATDPKRGAGKKRLPSDWVSQRSIGEARLAGSYANITTGPALIELEQALVAQLRALCIPSVDASTITGRQRRFMRFCGQVSRYIFDCSERGRPRFAGIHDMSRPSPDLRNWAIFERSDSRGFAQGPTGSSSGADQDLRAALDLLNIELAQWLGP